MSVIPWLSSFLLLGSAGSKCDAALSPSVPSSMSFPKVRSPGVLSSLASQGPLASWLSHLVISRILLPWLTEEVPAQQYLEIDEVTTDSFRVTWHPLSADEGQHKLMWIPVYGGKTQEVSSLEHTDCKS